MSFDETAASCPICLEPALTIRKIRFFCCGCVICSDCLEDNNSCPVHEGSQFFREDKTTADYVRKIEKLAKEYDRNYSASRDAFDQAVLEVRKYVWRANGGREEQTDSYQRAVPQSLPVQSNSQGYYANYYQAAENLRPAAPPSVEQYTPTCPRCTQPLTAVSCLCGYVDLSQVKTVAEEIVTCQQCGSQIPAGATCTKCIPSRQNVPSASSDVWTCTRCKYEYNLQTSQKCLKCHTLRVSSSETWLCKICFTDNSSSSSKCSYCSTPRVPQAVPPQPVQPQPAQTRPVQPVQTSASKVWTCTSCRYEYNLIDTGSCGRCGVAREVPVPRTKYASPAKPAKKDPAVPPKVEQSHESGYWVCTYCQNRNRAGASQCAGCYRSHNVPVSMPVTQQRGRLAMKCPRCSGRGCPYCSKQ